MKNRTMTAAVLALLLMASCTLTSCFGQGGGEETDPATDTQGKQVEQGLPVGDDTPEMTDTAPLPQITPTETAPPANEVDDVPGGIQNDDPSSDIPAVEMPDDEPAEDPDVTEPDTSVSADGALIGLAGQCDSGRFVSEQSPNLVLCIDWESVIGTDGIADVTVTVGISHYRLFSREKYNMGAIQVDGNAVKFSTPKIEYDENTKTYTEFYSATYETNRSEMEIEASWQVLGKYGDIEIDTLTAGGTVVLGGDS